MTEISDGRAGEILIENFFDRNFSKIVCFPKSRTSNHAQVSDVFVWLNRLALLIEVKTRTGGTGEEENWIRDRIIDGVGQIKSGYNRIKNKEEIFLINSYYSTQFDCEGIIDVIGIIILITETDSKYTPTKAVSDIYDKDLPIHVFTWNDIDKMTPEINTIPDLRYYLGDRFKYIKEFGDIPINCELNALGYYKTHPYNFPKESTNFCESTYWVEYQTKMAEKIAARNVEDESSVFVDKMESVFNSGRKLINGIPLGLYYAWELGALSRRERTYFGEKVNTVQDWFEAGKSSRYFSIFNFATGNWIILLFSKLSEDKIENLLRRLIELKLIKEIEENSFGEGVYGFGFQISTTIPHRLLGLSKSMALGASEVKGRYNEKDIEDSKRILGDSSSKRTIELREFPE